MRFEDRSIVHFLHTVVAVKSGHSYSTCQAKHPIPSGGCASVAVMEAADRRFRRTTVGGSKTIRAARHS